MWSWGKQPPGAPRASGRQAEDAALALLRERGMQLVMRNFRTPGRGGGEIDLIMREPDGTLVFVEVRQRRSGEHGGAAASIGAVKRRRLVFAARHFLARLRSMPRCRFDAVLFDGDHAPQWLRAAFDVDDAF